MKLLVLGTTGMVGQGALRAALADDRVTEVVSISRTSVDLRHPKLTEVLRPDLADLAGLPELSGLTAVLDCLGVSSLGLSEERYRAITVDLGVAIADAVSEASGTDVRFCYVSGSGTDRSEKGRVMWARVKGEYENFLLARFPNAVMFRPGVIWPLDGIRSKTRWVDLFYRGTRPLLPLARRVRAGLATDTRELGQAMVNAGLGADVPLDRIVESRDLGRVADQVR